jgi:hypothetical protein
VAALPRQAHRRLIGEEILLYDPCDTSTAQPRQQEKEIIMTVAELIRAQVDALPEEMQREALDFLLFLRMKATHAGHVCGADTEMLRFFGAAPDFPDRIPGRPSRTTPENLDALTA